MLEGSSEFEVRSMVVISQALFVLRNPALTSPSRRRRGHARGCGVKRPRCPKGRALCTRLTAAHVAGLGVDVEAVWTRVGMVTARVCILPRHSPRVHASKHAPRHPRRGPLWGPVPPGAASIRLDSGKRSTHGRLTATITRDDSQPMNVARQLFDKTTTIADVEALAKHESEALYLDFKDLSELTSEHPRSRPQEASRGTRQSGERLRQRAGGCPVLRGKGAEPKAR